jgi:hypothetical protein
MEDLMACPLHLGQRISGRLNVAAHELLVLTQTSNVLLQYFSGHRMT